MIRFFMLAMPAVVLCAGQAMASEQAPSARWADLPDLVQAVPPPPGSVMAAAQYAEADARLQQIEAQLEQYERRLEQMTEAADGQSGGDVVQQLSQAMAQGRDAERRLAQAEAEGNADDPERQAAETAAMRSATGQGAAGRAAAATGPAAQIGDPGQNGVVMHYASQMASRSLHEEQEVDRLRNERQREDAACSAGDSCSDAVERRYLGALVRMKDTIYVNVVSDWMGLRNHAETFATSSRHGFSVLGNDLVDGARVNGRRAADSLERLGQLGPVRTLLGMLGIMVSESRQRWDEASDIREQVLQQGTSGDS